jgi:hypothetical protein
MTQTENQQHNSSTAAIADDVAIFTGGARGAEDMQMQAKMIDGFLGFTLMEANIPKCAATGILHGAARAAKNAAGGLSAQQLADRLEQRIGNGRISIQGQAVPFLPPDEPYTYLDIMLTMTLNWRAQLQAALTKARSKCEQINSCLASPRQKLAMLETVVRPGLAYALHLAPYTPADIHTLDKLLARTAKRAFGLPVGTPTAAILLPTTNMGLGLSTLMADYVQKCGDMLVSSLNDTGGRLGTLTRRILDAQQRAAGTIAMQTVEFKGQLAAPFLLHQTTCPPANIRRLPAGQGHGQAPTRL